MASIELQLISRIIRTGCMAEVLDGGITEDDFVTDEGKHRFIHMMRHWTGHGGVPGENLYLQLYPTFDIVDDAVTPTSLLIHEVKRKRATIEARCAIDIISGQVDNDPWVAASNAIEHLERTIAATSPFRTTTLQELDLDGSRTDFLVPALGIGPGAPTLVAGRGFSGKTTATKALALAMAAGRSAWDFFPMRPGRVLHLDFEEGARRVGLAYGALARGMDVDLAKYNDALRIDFHAPMRGTPYSLKTLPAMKAWFKTTAAQYDLIVIDSLSAAFLGLKENEAEARAPLDMLQEVSSATGCVVLLVHHAAKTGYGRASIRGSGALFDAAGTVLVMEREDRAEFCRVTVEKARDVEAIPHPFTLRLSRPSPRAQLVQAAPMDTASATFPVNDAPVTRVRDALRKNGGSAANKTELRALARMKTDRMYEALATLRRNGEIREDGRRIILVESETERRRLPKLEADIRSAHLEN